MQITLPHLVFPYRLMPGRPLTDAELLEFCAQSDPIKVEREPNGDLLLMSPSYTETSFMNIAITKALDKWASEDDRGIVSGPDGGYTLADGSMRAPDAAWVLKDRFDKLSREERFGFARICPDFIIELRSESDRLPALKKKMESWLANGAQVGWLIDPKLRRVTIYRRGESPEEQADPTSVQGTGHVLGFELIMAKVWR